MTSGRRGASRRILLDASIAGCAGTRAEATDPATLACRDALKALSASESRAAFTPHSFEEWKRHRGTYSYAWLTSMHARRRVEFLPEPRANRGFRKAAAKRFGTEPPTLEKVQKDQHLVEAALAHHAPVLSRDDRMRSHMRALCGLHRELSRVHWVSPLDENCCQWLEAGAPDDPERRICQD